MDRGREVGKTARVCESVIHFTNLETEAMHRASRKQSNRRSTSASIRWSTHIYLILTHANSLTRKIGQSSRPLASSQAVQLEGQYHLPKTIPHPRTPVIHGHDRVSKDVKRRALGHRFAAVGHQFQSSNVTEDEVRSILCVTLMTRFICIQSGCGWRRPKWTSQQQRLHPYRPTRRSQGSSRNTPTKRSGSRTSRITRTSARLNLIESSATSARSGSSCTRRSDMPSQRGRHTRCSARPGKGIN